MLQAMTLDQYLAENKLTEAEFASRVGATQPNIHRLRKGQIPGKELMAAIVDKTGGQVRPDDFFGVQAA